MAEYLKVLEKSGSSVNVVPLVGHNNIRGAVMGYDSEVPSKGQLGKMKELLQESFDAGVWGFSTGLNMPPGSSSKQEEIVELCKVVNQNNGVYHTHIRGQGDRLLSAVIEAIETAKQSEVPLHILHHKGMGDANAAKVEFTLSMIDDEIDNGMNITMDMYPYVAGQGGLAMFIPFWAHVGGTKKLIERLQDRQLRKKMKWQMVEPELFPGYQSYTRELGWKTCWDKILICDSSSEKYQDIAGKSIAEAMPEGVDPLDFVFNLLIDEQGDVPVVIPDLIDTDDRYLLMVLQHPNTMFGSDGYSLATKGILAGGFPHPRSYGTFPRILGNYVRQRRLFTWKEAVRKMTYLPAMYLGITNRGVIKENTYADIVIFNPETVIDNSTFSNPHQYPSGIEYVITNGAITINRGEHTGALEGRVLRKK
jgi:N-acyl-D-amino-acid deacylase